MPRLIPVPSCLRVFVSSCLGQRICPRGPIAAAGVVAVNYARVCAGSKGCLQLGAGITRKICSERRRRRGRSAAVWTGLGPAYGQTARRARAQRAFAATQELIEYGAPIFYPRLNLRA